MDLCDISRRCLAIAIVLAATAFVSAADAPRPSIVLVIVDDLRWDDIGCAGHPFSQTPQIDQLAKEGARFTNAFITTPLCSPSRASILTGQYAHATASSTTPIAVRPAIAQDISAGTPEGTATKRRFSANGTWGTTAPADPASIGWYCLAGQGTSFDAVVNDNGKTVQTKGYVTDVLNAESASSF